MGIVLDSSVAIAAERRGDNVTELLQQIFAATGDQRAVLSAIGLTELVHGAYRTPTPETRVRRELFIQELLIDIEVYPFTKETALLAGRIDGEQQARGVTIPFSDLLIGATARLHGYSVLTVNIRHFQLIPGLTVLSL
ncbi:MAG: PIN domain-containing protein [Candidatus Korobacteraceae bacterium]